MPVGIQVKLETLQAGPIEAVVRFGECYGTKIIWDKPVIVKLNFSEKANIEGQSGIVADGYGWGYAGFEEATGTYWRYQHEVNPDSYREHCMQVISTELTPVTVS